MHNLKADTAATVLVGPFVATANGVTPVTTISLGAGNASTLLFKNNSETGVDISGNTLTHKRMGWYILGLTTGNLDTEGRLSIFMGNSATHLPVWYHGMVMKANAYAGLYGQTPTDYLKVDVRSLNATVTQPADVPASNCKLGSALAFLYAMLLNKTITSSSLLTLRNYSDTASVCAASLTDDGSIFTRYSFINT